MRKDLLESTFLHVFWCRFFFSWTHPHDTTAVHIIWARLTLSPQKFNVVYVQTIYVLVWVVFGSVIYVHIEQCMVATVVPGEM